MTPGDADGSTYESAGLTDPGAAGWAADAPGSRRFEGTVVVGHGGEVWARAGNAVLQWGVKRRNGAVARTTADHGLATPVSVVLVPLAAASDGPG